MGARGARGTATPSGARRASGASQDAIKKPDRISIGAQRKGSLNYFTVIQDFPKQG